jgi:hypothetical protein
MVRRWRSIGYFPILYDPLTPPRRHQVEMAKASRVDVALQLAAVPVLAGALELMQQGVFSSLQPQNTRLSRAVSNHALASQHAAYPLLFDPQASHPTNTRLRLKRKRSPWRPRVQRCYKLRIVDLRK